MNVQLKCWCLPMSHVVYRRKELTHLTHLIYANMTSNMVKDDSAREETSYAITWATLSD